MRKPLDPTQSRMHVCAGFQGHKTNIANVGYRNYFIASRMKISLAGNNEEYICEMVVAYSPQRKG
jgi:hypothetical protein